MTPLRQKLREATGDAHERLHRHPELSAAASGRIDIDGYRTLLTRLYGFHRAFDDRIAASTVALSLGIMRARSGLLEGDLAALGVTEEMRRQLPLCEKAPRLANAARALGALYVIEGSALGGAQIARALKSLLEPFDGAGRRFFSNDGQPSRGWPVLLARIEQLAGDDDRERELIAAAVETFQIFEEWMTLTPPGAARAAMGAAYCAPSAQ